MLTLKFGAFMYEVIDDTTVKDWVRSAFLLPPGSFDSNINKYRKMPDGLFNFSDTTLGGNKAINPLPQFTGFADVNEERYTTNKTDKYSFLHATNSMGRDYSERFDQTQILIHMRFGIPTYTSMTQFFGNFYNPQAAQLANKGRSNQIARAIGRIIGTVATFRILPYILLGQTLRFLFDMPSTRYYSLKPTMHVYNDARSSILNTLLSNMGVVAGMANSERPEQYKEGAQTNSPEDWNRLLPDVYNSDGSVDIYNVTTRWQRMANKRYEKIKDALDSSVNHENAMKEIAKIYRSTGHPNDPVIDEGRGIDEYVGDYFSLDLYKLAEAAEKPTEDPNSDKDFAAELQTNIANQPSETASDMYGDDKSWYSEFATSLLAEQRDGGQFVSFRIDKPSASSFSVNNSIAESGLQSTMNSMSSNAKNVRFNLADGNLIGGPIGSVIGAITSSVGALLSGIGESVGVSGLAMLMGNALADIPKHWEESVTNAPRINAKMECRAWSSDPITRIQNLLIPAVSLMAGCIPRSTGFSSYTGPFICEYYCKGRAQSRLAIIDSFTMTIGSGNIGHTKNGIALGYDLEFSLIDLSSITHMPLTAGFNPLDFLLPSGLSKYLLSDESNFTDLMAVMGNLDLVDQIYTTRRLKRNFHKATLDFQQWTSPAKWASVASNAGWLFGAQGGRMLSAFANPSDRGG